MIKYESRATPASTQRQRRSDRARIKVAVIVPFYYPANRAGGPPRSIRSRVLSTPDLDFVIVTSDRDAGARTPFPPPYRHGAVIDGATVHYVPTWGLRVALRAWKDILSSDFVWINSLHSPRYAIGPILLLQFTRLRRRIIVSPRGELIPEHIRRSRLKKATWHTVLKFAGVHKRVTWLATAESEIRDIESTFQGASTRHSPEQTRLAGRTFVPKAPSGVYRLLYLGRVTERKGISHALHALANAQQPATLTIAGPLDDTRFESALQRKVTSLGLDDRVEWLGSVPEAAVPSLLESHDALILPTTGENFGHSIAEALAVGRPVLLTPTTPWTFAAESGAVVLIDRNDYSRTAAAIDLLATEGTNASHRRQHEAWLIGQEGLSRGDSLEDILHEMRARCGGS